VEVARVEVFEHAVLTPFRRVPLDALGTQVAHALRRRVSRHRHDVPAPRYRLSGAVYADGVLVAASQRQAFVAEAPMDPRALPPTAEAPSLLHGRWLYGGHWMPHFGHFLLESLSALWPEPAANLDGLVFHRWRSRPSSTPSAPTQWQHDLLRRAGWAGGVRFVDAHALTAEQLLVPTRAYRLHDGALPEAVTLWDRIAGSAAAGAPVFLSRARLRHDRRRIRGGEQLDGALADAGVVVVHPERLPIEEQLSVVASASTLIGVSGSQLHLAMFAPNARRIIEIGDPRLPTSPVHDQVLIARARAQEHCFVPLVRGRAGRDVSATVRHVLELLER